MGIPRMAHSLARIASELAHCDVSGGPIIIQVADDQWNAHLE